MGPAESDEANPDPNVKISLPTSGVIRVESAAGLADADGSAVPPLC